MNKRFNPGIRRIAAVGRSSEQLVETTVLVPAERDRSRQRLADRHIPVAVGLRSQLETALVEHRKQAADAGRKELESAGWRVEWQMVDPAEVAFHCTVGSRQTEHLDIRKAERSVGCMLAALPQILAGLEPCPYPKSTSVGGH